MFKGLPFAKALRDLGHEVEVLTGFPNYPGGNVYPGYSIRPWQREFMDGIPVNRVMLYPSHDRSGLRRILNYISFGLSAATIGPALVRRPDVVYVYNLVTLGFAANVLRTLHKCPIVLDVQDLWPDSVTKSGMLNNAYVIRFLNRWCNSVYKKADYLTVLSPGFKRILSERGVSEDRIEVIYNWCDENQIQVADRDESLAQELGFSGRFNVVFAGTMGKMQALDAVLDAARLLKSQAPNVQFVFIGGGTDVDCLKQKAKELELHNVKFLARRPVTEIGSIIQLADVLLVHLKKDPLFEVTIPSKIQAYLAAGRPILAGVRGDAAKLVEMAAAGCSCNPEDPKSISEAILTMSRMSPSELRSTGERGRKYYSDNLSLRAGVHNFSNLFSRVVEEQR